MPWAVFKHGDGWGVWKIDGEGNKVGSPYSKEPQSRRKAEAQKRALYANSPDNHKSLDLDFLNSGIIFVGDTLKSLSAADGKIGAYSVIFGDESAQDFHGNWFTKSTFLGHNDGDGVVATINHRMPLFERGQFGDSQVEEIMKDINQHVMKNPVHTMKDEIGLFSELICDLSDKYEKMVYELTKRGKLKWSSGTAPQLFKAKKSGELEMFVIAEQALTPIPAEYRMLDHRVMPIKNYFEFLKGGPGSGHFNHAGRPGEQGGSKPGKGKNSEKRQHEAAIGRSKTFEDIPVTSYMVRTELRRALKKNPNLSEKEAMDLVSDELDASGKLPGWSEIYKDEKRK